MRIATWNVNGLRSALAKHFHAHVDALGPDVLLLQEVRARTDQLPPDVAQGWVAHWHPAVRPGYAGTAVWTRGPSELLEIGPGSDEGRVIRVRVGGLQVVSVYLPSGSSSPERQAAKDTFMAQFADWLAPLAALPEPVIVGGDLNVAPTAQDIHDPRGNKNNSGFLPHERAWFAQVCEAGWTDLLRATVGPGQGPYSWWSNRGRARILDRGWRIDHMLGNRAAAERLAGAFIRREGGLDTSDHAPVVVDLNPG